MKNFKTTLVFALIVLVFAGYAFYDYRKGGIDSAKTAENQSVIDFKADEVVSFEVVSNTGVLALASSGGKWSIVSPFEYESDQPTVMGLLQNILDERVLEVVFAAEEKFELESLGLDQPVFTVNLTAKDGRRRSLKIGKKAYDNNLYAQLDERKEVLLVSANWDAYLSKPAASLRTKNLYRNQNKPDRPARIQIVQNGKVRVDLMKESDGWVTPNHSDRYPLDTETVATYLDLVKGLRGIDYVVEDKSAKGALASSGLQLPDFEIRLFSSEKTPYYSLQISGERVTSSDIDAILSVYPNAVDNLKKELSYFQDRKAPFKFDPKDVAGIAVDAKIGERSLRAKFVKSGDKWASDQEGLLNDFNVAKLNEVPIKLSRLQAVRILEPVSQASVRKKLEAGNKIALSSSSGELIFEMIWGNPLREGGSAEGSEEGTPEATYLPARTNLTDRLIGVTEGSVESLDLDELLGKVDPGPSGSARK